MATSNTMARLFILLCYLLLSACGDDITTIQESLEDPVSVEDPVIVSPDPVVALDTDDDGLNDDDELLIGTSIYLRDTDGDGFDDFQEVIEYGFNPANNNFRFNPLIADVPKLAIEVTSVPSVNLRYETTTGSKVTIGVERSEESARTVSTSDTSTNSIATEDTHTVGVEVGYQTGPTGGASVSLNYEYSTSTTTESSFSHTEEQRKENRQAVSNSEAFEEENSIKETGGELELNVRIRNDGDLAFRLDNLIIGAVMVDPLNSGQILPVANLDIDTTFLSFPATTLAPNQTTGNLLFDNDDLTVEEAKTLLRDASGLIIDVALSEVVNQDGVAFAFNRTEVGLKTASVIIDFGGYLPTERYLVATNVDEITQRVSLQTVMTDILRAPYMTSGTGVLSSLRGIAESASKNAYWVAVLITDNGLVQTATTLNPISVDYDFNMLTLQSGDVLQLTYMEDADNDGLGLRREFITGTDPTLADTDGDLLEDGAEVEGVELTVDRGDGAGAVTVTVRSNPKTVDTDGDGLTDAEEFSLADPSSRTDPTRADTDGDRMLDSYDRMPRVFQSLDLGAITTTRDFSGAEKLVYFYWTDDVILTSGEDLRLIVRRQEVAIGAPFLEISDPATGTCVDGSICYPLLYDFDESVFVPGFLRKLILDYTNGPLGLSLERDYKYLLYAQVDGNLILLDTVSIDTATTQQSITVNISEIYTTTCLDSYKPADAAFNLVCELFWDFKIDGVTLAGVSEADHVETTSGTSQAVNTPLTFNVANLPGSCFTLRAEIWESDTSITSTREGDDLLRPISETYCYPDWGSTGDVHQRDAVHEKNTSSVLELIDVTMFYTIIKN